MKGRAIASHLPALRRLVRYASVSAISTTTSLSVLGVLVGMLGMPAVLSNFVATAVGTVPSFELNRRWVWTRDDRPSFARQIVPFCALSFAGLLLSSLSVHFAGTATAPSSRLVHTSAVELANFGSYGLLWVLQFFLCDKVLFKVRDGAPVTGDRAPSVRPTAHEEHGHLLVMAGNQVDGVGGPPARV